MTDLKSDARFNVHFVVAGGFIWDHIYTSLVEKVNEVTQKIRKKRRILIYTSLSALTSQQRGCVLKSTILSAWSLHRFPGGFTAILFLSQNKMSIFRFWTVVGGKYAI